MEAPKFEVPVVKANETLTLADEDFYLEEQYYTDNKSIIRLPAHWNKKEINYLIKNANPVIVWRVKCRTPLLVKDGGVLRVCVNLA